MFISDDNFYHSLISDKKEEPILESGSETETMSQNSQEKFKLDDLDDQA